MGLRPFLKSSAYCSKVPKNPWLGTSLSWWKKETQQSIGFLATKTTLAFVRTSFGNMSIGRWVLITLGPFMAAAASRLCLAMALVVFLEPWRESISKNGDRVRRDSFTSNCTPCRICQTISWNKLTIIIFCFVLKIEIITFSAKQLFFNGFSFFVEN